ncbi:hypothetical protein BN891_31170 [Bacteroides xylanisolvens SD CC 2a]|nr:hypothetical protein BN891_31170 [Bacteroides xylanisolvens SD CC 2a]
MIRWFYLMAKVNKKDSAQGGIFVQSHRKIGRNLVIFV